jgi:demethylmenaquinone methyltransferase/2-methoxy-6-polyprenyl-1,4-benzoquinol methylase
MLDYYSRRAAEYEAVYEKPERQGDLAELGRLVASLFAGRRVLELACGTGWWTRRIAPVAESVLATDASEAMLGEARRHCAGLLAVTFRNVDAFALPAGLAPPSGRFDAHFAGFLWSHVRRSALPGLVASLAAVVPGGRFAFTDNRFVDDSNTPISRTDAEGNGFQVRTLADGSTHEVMKNFPSVEEIRAVLAPHASDVQVVELTYYWLVWGRFTAGTAG